MPKCAGRVSLRFRLLENCSMMRWLCCLICLPLWACCGPVCGYRYCTEGAQEFVLDSYQISQGKFSILELEGECFEPLAPELLFEYEDRIDEDDVLRIAVFHPTRTDLMAAVSTVGQNIGYRVVKGEIFLPILGAVKVKTLTLNQARTHIQNLYAAQISPVDIFIDYAERLHSKVELTGAVKVPEIPINGRIRLYEVLALAGVPADANLFKSYVVRSGSLLPVDLYKLMHEGDMSQNIVMYPNDKIFIAEPAAACVTVLGEVGLAQVIPVLNGTISLRVAIAAAGGIPFTGDKRCIQVIRGNIINPKIYRLSWEHITYLPNDSLLLMPGDTVYISEKPITKWNRFIEQLLPSSLLIDLGIRTRGVFH
jgi:polysaccharide biosynthesis/export protein